MEPLYKVGDKILIKQKYDKGCQQGDYKFLFLPSMLFNYGGKICTIKTIEKSNVSYIFKIHDDGYKYTLEENKSPHKYYWSSGMFESEF